MKNIFNYFKEHVKNRKRKKIRRKFESKKINERTKKKFFYIFEIFPL